MGQKDSYLFSTEQSSLLKRYRSYKIESSELLKLMIWFVQIKYAFNLMQTLNFGAIKLSVLFFYRRIFRGKWFDIATKSMIAIVTIWTFGFFFTIMFECRLKFWAFWSTLDNLLTYCVDDVLFQKVLSISDVITDGLILSIPLPIVSS